MALRPRIYYSAEQKADFKIPGFRIRLLRWPLLVDRLLNPFQAYVDPGVQC
jgi:hypothetical protein